jgi:hypothetical protein
LNLQPKDGWRTRVFRGTSGAVGSCEYRGQLSDDEVRGRLGPVPFTRSASRVDLRFVLPGGLHNLGLSDERIPLP